MVWGDKGRGGKCSRQVPKNLECFGSKIFLAFLLLPEGQIFRQRNWHVFYGFMKVERFRGFGSSLFQICFDCFGLLRFQDFLGVSRVSEAGSQFPKPVAHLDTEMQSFFSEQPQFKL